MEKTPPVKTLEQAHHEALQDMLDGHDCTLSPEDSCECQKYNKSAEI